VQACGSIGYTYVWLDAIRGQVILGASLLCIFDCDKFTEFPLCRRFIVRAYCGYISAYRLHTRNAQKLVAYTSGSLQRRACEGSIDSLPWTVHSLQAIGYIAVQLLSLRNSAAAKFPRSLNWSEDSEYMIRTRAALSWSSNCGI